MTTIKIPDQWKKPVIGEGHKVRMVICYKVAEIHENGRHIVIYRWYMRCNKYWQYNIEDAYLLEGQIERYMEAERNAET